MPRRIRHKAREPPGGVATPRHKLVYGIMPLMPRTALAA
jgi:hypothetical protein